MHVAVFPALSATVHTTFVLPNMKTPGALLVIEAIPQLSVVTGVPKSTPVAVQPVFVYVVFVGGQVIVGNTLSFTVTNCSQVAMLPELSTTVQVTTVVPKGNARGASLVTEATPQLSAVVGVPKITPVAVQVVLVTVTMFAGHIIVGLTLSVMVTVWVLVVAFPEASVAVQVTVVFPIGKAAGASFVITTEQLSLYIGVPILRPAAVHPKFVVAAIFAGLEMVGNKLSNTVTIALALAWLLFTSVTVKLTVFAPKSVHEKAY